MAAGFDGVCLQGLDAYDNDPIDVAADREKIDPSKAMLDFVTAVRTHVRQAKSDGIVLALNASDFLDDQPGFAKEIDGLVAEDSWFSGSDDAKWDDPTAGDQPNNDSDEDSTAGLIRQYHKFLDAGVPVFTIDYCVKQENADRVYRESAREGFIPLVTRVSADNVTTTPPPGDAAPNPSAADDAAITCHNLTSHDLSGNSPAIHRLFRAEARAYVCSVVAGGSAG